MDNPKDHFVDGDIIDDTYQDNIHATVSTVLENSFKDEIPTMDPEEKSTIVALNDATREISEEISSCDAQEVTNVSSVGDDSEQPVDTEVPSPRKEEGPSQDVCQDVNSKFEDAECTQTNVQTLKETPLTPTKDQAQESSSAINSPSIVDKSDSMQLTPPKEQARASIELSDVDPESKDTNDSEEGSHQPLKKQTTESPKVAEDFMDTNDGQEAEKMAPAPKRKRGRPPTRKVHDSDVKENQSEDGILSKTKRLRAPTKKVKYSELNSSSEKLFDEDQVPVNEKKKQGKPSSYSNNKTHNHSTPKPVEVSSSSSRSVQKEATFSKKENDEDEKSIFLPEGWFFYASKRKTSLPNAKQYDIYYLTPQPRIKLRSRKELVNYMTAHGLDYDPFKFFLKSRIDPLLEKGVLKLLDSGHVVFSNADEATISSVCKTTRPVIKIESNLESPTKQTRSPRNVLRKSTPSNSIQTSPKAKFSLAMKSKVSTSESKTEEPAEKGMSTPPRKPGRERRKKSVPGPAVEIVSPPQSTQTLDDSKRTRPKTLKKSPYFSLNANGAEKPKNLESLRSERKISDAPPRSPYNLIQEDLFHDPWQMLIATIFLNSTSGRLAIPLALEFLKRWPTPELARQAKVDDILDIIEPLGFGRTRAAIILRFSHEYLTKDWKLPNELYGIGEYGNDSYKIFCMKNAWKTVESDDPMLMMYLNWRRATEHIRKRFVKPANKSSSKNLHKVNSSVKSKEMSHSTQLRLSPRKRTRTATK